MEYQEIQLSPLQKAITMYKFVCKDLQEGLEYQVSAEVYNSGMEALGTEKRIEQKVSSREYAEDFYGEYLKRKKVN